MVRTFVGPGPAAYTLRPLVGYPDHDPSKYRNPQYSMGIKLSTQRKNVGPGPLEYTTANMTAHGKASPPMFSIASRPKPIVGFSGPGPAAYTIKQTPPNPKYSMAFRHNINRLSGTPGPNEYKIPTTIGPKVPDLPAGGAYSISGRHPMHDQFRSPGPAGYDPVIPPIYKTRPPAYSMGRKIKPLGSRGGTPGPSDYYPKFKRDGGYSFGLKHDLPPYITPEDNMPCINK